MKRVLVTFVLALTTAAWGQGSSPSQQPPAAQPPAAQQPAAGDQQANVPTSQKVIKDPAEYNAYITALNTTDPAAKGAAMEAFVAQYPNSIVKSDALQQAMGAYQQASNQQKVEQLARQILAIRRERGRLREPFVEGRLVGCRGRQGRLLGRRLRRALRRQHEAKDQKASQSEPGRP